MRSRRNRRAVMVLLAVSMTASAASGQSTWDGGSAANNNWSNGFNWVGDVAPTNLGTEEIIFAGSVRTSPNLDVSRSHGRVRFTSSSSFNVTNAGTVLTLSGSTAVTVEGSGNASLSPSVVFPNATAVSATSANLTFNGSTSFTLSSTSTASAGRTVAYNGSLSLNAGLTLTASGTHTMSGLMSAGAGSVVRITSGQTSRNPGVDAFDLPNTTVTVSGTLVTQSPNQFGNGVNVAGGTLDLAGTKQTIPGDLTLSSLAVVTSALPNGTIAATGVFNTSGGVTISNVRLQTDVVANVLSGTLTVAGGLAGTKGEFNLAAASAINFKTVAGGVNLATFSGGGALVLDVCPVNVGGSMQLSSTAVSLTNTVVAQVPLQNVLVSGGQVSITDSFTMVGLTVGAGAGVVNTSSLGVTGPTSVDGTVDIRASSGDVVALGSTFNRGLFTITNIGSGSVTIASMSNQSGATLRLAVGTMAMPVSNGGLLDVIGNSSITAYTQLNGGTLAIAQTAGLTCQGPFLISQPMLMNFGGTLLVSGPGVALTNNSTLTLGNVIVSVGSGASFINNRLISGGGTFSGGRFSNVGTWSVVGGASFQGTATFTNEATGTINIPLGGDFTTIAPPTGPTAMANLGRVNLSGGSWGQNVALTNSLTGMVSGFGTVSSPVRLLNQGQLVPSGGTLAVLGTVRNSGVVRLADGATLLASVENAGGLVTGDGAITFDVNNQTGGRIQPTGQLAVFGFLTMGAGSSMTLPVGTSFVNFGGLVGSNAGQINLSGGSLDFGSNVLTNGAGGKLSGYGLIGAFSIFNSGQINLAGGTTIVNPALTNNPAATMRVDAGAAIFNSLVTNNGSIVVGPGGYAVFTGGFVGGTPLSEPGPTDAAVAGSGSMVLSAGAAVQTNGVKLASLAFNGAPASAASVVVLSRQPGGIIAPAGRSVNQSVSVLGGISVASNGGSLGSRVYFGSMDLADNDLIIRGGDLALIRDWIRAGLVGGNGLYTSSAGTGGVNNLATLGVVTPDFGSGFPEFASFEGVAVGLADVIVKYTYFGDTNLDGKVDATDFNRVVNGFTNGLTGWHNGDSNYDGVVNGLDYQLMLSALVGQGASFAPLDGGGGAIPEPAGLVAIAGVGVLLGRRRRE
jgi:hypothetical protein